MTLFADVYNYFLNKITDDMYLELTPRDTIRDLQNLLLDAIPGFEFPRTALDYTINLMELEQGELKEDDFIIGTTWGEIVDTEEPAKVIVDRSFFENDLSQEEINILALIMKQAWVQRQVTSIENTRMKYTGTDFKMTSQANHLAKLLSLLEESRRDSFHMQRLYKRRSKNEDGKYISTWTIFGDYD